MLVIRSCHSPDLSRKECIIDIEAFRKSTVLARAQAAQQGNRKIDACRLITVIMSCHNRRPCFEDWPIVRRRASINMRANREALLHRLGSRRADNLTYNSSQGAKLSALFPPRIFFFSKTWIFSVFGLGCCVVLC